jgi:hypothetical protein
VCRWAGEGKYAGPTLVVTPPAILQQWCNELAEHSHLQVVVYDGLKWQRKEAERAQHQGKKRVRGPGAAGWGCWQARRAGLAGDCSLALCRQLLPSCRAGPRRCS